MIVLFATMEASNLLGFAGLSEIVRSFVGLGGHVLLVLVIIGFGLLLAKFVARIVRTSDSPNTLSCHKQRFPCRNSHLLQEEST